MSKYLNELMRFSDKGYVDGYDNVEEAVDNMLNTRLEEIQFSQSYDPAVLVRRLFILNNVPNGYYDVSYLAPEYLVRLKLSETIALAEHYYDYDEKRGYGSVNLSSQVYEMLFYAAKRCFNAQFFLSVSVKALADYADKISGGTKGSEMYSCIEKAARETLSLTVDGTLTLYDLFSKLESVMRYNSVSIGLNAFNDRVRCGRNILKRVLTDSIRLIRPEIFDFDGIKKRICGELGVAYYDEPMFPFVDTLDSEDDPDDDETFYGGNDDEDLFDFDALVLDDDFDFDLIDPVFEDEKADEYNGNGHANKNYDGKKDTHFKNAPIKKKSPSWDEVVAPFRRLSEKKG